MSRGDKIRGLRTILGSSRSSAQVSPPTPTPHPATSSDPSLNLATPSSDVMSPSNITPSPNVTPPSIASSPQPFLELVAPLEDPDLSHFATSVGQEVGAALKDVTDAIGHFPFLKTIGGLTAQILKIFEGVRDNPGEWERLALNTRRTFWVLQGRLLSNQEGMQLDIQPSCEWLKSNLESLLNVQ
ncbi:hypothetical protein JAAARDRAFT_68511 [Jaapia argillacea MUCL 33604]|uniref:Uncharacterized protein n=1 Tax=Jaapia argillacea MUCL 33604 TaxID=933084 RepID=A0A067PVN1_9AGAM|nr:hypothetical protein JAAARDRAFT_68511 [Jaapia argillacea MUCL 33604]